MESDPVSALILAGGKATRLGGVAKHEIVVEGRTIFERQVAVLAPRVAEIVVSCATPIARYRTVVDAIVDGGPLAGIAAGLEVVTTPWLLVVAGDMPFLGADLIELMIARRGDDGVGIELAGLPQPLCCVLRCEVARPALARMLATGQRKASRLLTDAGLRMRWLAETDLTGIDRVQRALANVNTFRDLPAAK